MEMDHWERDSPEERVKRVRFISEESASLVGVAGGTGQSMWGSTMGPAAGYLLWN